jgi:hypothetical protein
MNKNRRFISIQIETVAFDGLIVYKQTEIN